MKKNLTFLIFVLLISQAHASPKTAYTWNLLDEGILYTNYSFESGPEERTAIHAFQVDPPKVRMDVVLANLVEEPLGVGVESFAKGKKAAIVINGGFFTPDHKPIGLLIGKDGRQLNPIHRTSWWSIFGLRDGKPFIEVPREFVSSPQVSFAVQAGPRLIVNGTIPKLKNGVAARSVVGITKDGKIIFVVTEGSPISMYEMAKRMKDGPFEGGLGCVNAMALDGGASSQLYAKIKKFELSIPGLATIPDGIAVYKK